MIKDIKYGGYTAQPSDYECQDGELSMSLNLLNEDGNIKTLFDAHKELSVHSGHEVLLIHSVPGQENIIILTGDRKEEFGLSWIKRDPALSSTMDAAQIGLKSPLKQLLAISIVGNTLAVATSEGVFYILWKDDDYKYLGNRPPFLPISFGAYKQGTLTETKTTSYSTVPTYTHYHYSGKYSGGQIPHDVKWSSDDDSFWASVSNQSLGLLLSEVADKVTSQGYMYQPYFIRYAFRLYDGSYSWHSAPVLMLVSTHRPVISISCGASGENGLNIICRLAVPYFGLAYRVYGTLDLLKEWSDIVTGVDIFISQPLYTYDQGKDIGAPIPRYQLYQGLIAGYGGGGRNDHFSDTSTSPDSTAETDDTTEAATETDAATEAATSDTEKTLIGHYAEATSSTAAINGAYIDHFVTPSLSEMSDLVCALAKSDSFNDRVQHEYLFYKVATLDLEDIKSMTKMERLLLVKTDLTNINTLETLPDDYNSHATVIPSSLYTYNRRLVMGDLSVCPPAPLPTCSLVQAATFTSSPDQELPVDASDGIKVFTRVNGKKCVSEYSQSLLIHLADPGPYPFSQCFPRFIYHPDPSAYKMEITSRDGKFYSLPLKQHPHLNGAYWFGGFREKPTGIGEERDLTVAASSAIVGNKIYISDVDNPFRFPVENIITLGCGRVFNICSSAKALSQGQFGQFPLYAFTDDGIWALEISPTGTIIARQPITRDVCINPDGIAQIDSAVLFPTDRGIMLISGSNATCISEAINDDMPFDISTLPHLSELHTSLGHITCSCLPVQSFTKFLCGCSMIYDYPHQRIIVYNREYTYAYVFSLKTKMWGMKYSTIDYNINSYPQALAVTNDGKMVNFAETDGEAVGGLLVTRPLKLDAADVLKTVDTIIQRGNFRKGHVQSVVYGSRDLYNWSLVWSSKDHFLRGFRGTPYKYFRIALLCNLAEDESIYGATVQYDTRKTNKPR